MCYGVIYGSIGVMFNVVTLTRSIITWETSLWTHLWGRWQTVVRKATLNVGCTNLKAGVLDSLKGRERTEHQHPSLCAFWLQPQCEQQPHPPAAMPSSPWRGAPLNGEEVTFASYFVIAMRKITLQLMTKWEVLLILLWFVGHIHNQGQCSFHSLPRDKR